MEIEFFIIFEKKIIKHFAEIFVWQKVELFIFNVMKNAFSII